MPAIINLDNNTVYRVKESRKEVSKEAKMRNVVTVTIIDVVVPGHPVHELGLIDLFTRHIVSVQDSKEG